MQSYVEYRASKESLAWNSIVSEAVVAQRVRARYKMLAALAALALALTLYFLFCSLGAIFLAHFFSIASGSAAMFLAGQGWDSARVAALAICEQEGLPPTVWKEFLFISPNKFKRAVRIARAKSDVDEIDLPPVEEQSASDHSE